MGLNIEEMEELSLEEAFERVDETMRSLQEEGIPLEDSFRLYKEGMELLKYCSDKIDHVEKQVLVMGEEGELNEFQ